MTTLQKHFFFSSLSCMCMRVGVIFPVALQLFRTSNWNRPMGRSSFVIRLGSIVNFVHSFNSQPIPCGLPRAARLYYPVLTILQGVVIKLKKKCPTFRTSGIGISDTCSIDNQSNCLVQQKKPSSQTTKTYIDFSCPSSMSIHLRSLLYLVTSTDNSL